MSLANILVSQVQSAMRILGTEDGGLAATHTYIRYDTSGSTYDPSTGTMVTKSEKFPAVPMVLTGFSIDEMDSSIIPTTDQKALIAAADIPFQPEEQDGVMLSNGVYYMVMRVLGVPGNSLYKLHIRKTKEPVGL